MWEIEIFGGKLPFNFIRRWIIDVMPPKGLYNNISIEEIFIRKLSCAHDAKWYLSDRMTSLPPCYAELPSHTLNDESIATKSIKSAIKNRYRRKQNRNWMFILLRLFFSAHFMLFFLYIFISFVRHAINNWNLSSERRMNLWISQI